MAELDIVYMGNPSLREKSQDVPVQELPTDEIKNLISQMTETMRAVGGIGLAAPQVGKNIRLCIIELEKDNERYEEINTEENSAQQLSVYINPRVTILDDTLQYFWEGCLSVPGLRGEVARPRKIQVDYWDENGTQKSLVAEDFLATVFQHEFDHLDGVLYVDRIKDKAKFAFDEEYLEYWCETEDDDDETELAET